WTELDDSDWGDVRTSLWWHPATSDPLEIEVNFSGSTVYIANMVLLRPRTLSQPTRPRLITQASPAAFGASIGSAATMTPIPRPNCRLWAPSMSVPSGSATL